LWRISNPTQQQIRNEREAATLKLVFPECLRHAFALASLPKVKKGRRQTQGNVAAQPHHKQEFFVMKYIMFKSSLRLKVEKVKR